MHVTIESCNSIIQFKITNTLLSFFLSCMQTVNNTVSIVDNVEDWPTDVVEQESNQ